MAEEKTHDGGLGLAEVDVTIEVVPGPAQPILRKPLAGTWVRVGFAFVGLVAAVAAGVIIAASPGTGPSRAAGHAPGIPVPQSAGLGGVVTRFGVRSHCVRRAVVSPDGTYALVDFERATACGTAGNHVTIILRRERGAWVPKFDATGWRCPRNLLPPPVLAELQLCHERSRQLGHSRRVRDRPGGLSGARERRPPGSGL
jgi:hypothetical protein